MYQLYIRFIYKGALFSFTIANPGTCDHLSTETAPPDYNQLHHITQPPPGNVSKPTALFRLISDYHVCKLSK